MRVILLIPIIWCATAFAAVTLVQHKSSAQGATPQTVVPTSSVTGGNLLVVIVSSVALGHTHAMTVTDNNSNSYTCGALLNDTTNTNNKYTFCWVNNPTLTTNPPTITCADAVDGSNHLECNVREYSGATATADGQSGSTSSNTTAATTNNLVTTATDLLVAGCVNTGAATWSSAGSGWTTAPDTDNGSERFIFMDQLNVASGTYNGTANLSGANSTWGCGVAALKAAAAAASGGVMGPGGVLGPKGIVGP